MAFGSGYLEGVLTAPLIWDTWYNYVQNQWNGTTPAVIAQFFEVWFLFIDTINTYPLFRRTSSG